VAHAMEEEEALAGEARSQEVEEEEAQVMEVGDPILVVAVVLVVKVMATELGDPVMVAAAALLVEGMSLEVRVVMGEEAMDLEETALKMGLENAPLEEGGLLEGGVTVQSMEVAQVLLDMLPTSDICMEKSTSRMGRRHSRCYWREVWLSCPPQSHHHSDCVADNPEVSFPFAVS